MTAPGRLTWYVLIRSYTRGQEATEAVMSLREASQKVRRRPALRIRPPAVG